MMNEISSAELAQWIQRGLHVAVAEEGESVDFDRVPIDNSRFATFSVRLPHGQAFVISIEELWT